MVRSAAKNWRDVAVLTRRRSTTRARRAEDRRHQQKTKLALLGGRVQSHRELRRGDQRDYLSSIQDEVDGSRALARQFNAGFVRKVQDLRYGENPHQARPSTANAHARPPARWPPPCSCRARSSRTTTSPMPTPPGNASGASTRRLRGRQARQPLRRGAGCRASIDAPRRRQTDPTSAFGGIIALEPARSTTRGPRRHRRQNKQFVEVLIAAERDAEARAIFAAKQNVRVLRSAGGDAVNALDFKRVGGGLLAESPTRKRGARRAARGHQARSDRGAATTCCSPGRWPSS